MKRTKIKFLAPLAVGSLWIPAYVLFERKQIKPTMKTLSSTSICGGNSGLIGIHASLLNSLVSFNVLVGDEEIRQDNKKKCCVCPTSSTLRNHLFVNSK